MFSKLKKKQPSSSGQKTGSHMLCVFISGTYRQTCSLSGSINLNWTSTSICLILSRLQLLLNLMWHTWLTWLPFTLRHVVFYNLLCGTLTTVVLLTIIIIKNHYQKENKNHSTITLYLQMLLRKSIGKSVFTRSCREWMLRLLKKRDGSS